MSFAPLTTARLVLRRLTADDAATVAGYRADPAIARYQGWQAADADPARLAASLFGTQCVGEPDDAGGAGLLVAIIRRADGALVGDCTLRARGEEPGTAELGYSLAPAHHGHGYATEATAALCRWALALPNVARIVAITDARNRPSIAVLERLGMDRIATVETKVRGELTTALWFQLTAALLAARDGG